MNEYRCTRNSPYGYGCPGFKDLASRQGHYINATSEKEAIQIMMKQFPNDMMGFTVTLWRNSTRELVN